MIIIQPISAIAFSIGPVAIRWYALAYVAAFVLGFWMLKKLTSSSRIEMPKKSLDDLFTALILGVIIGGRLGYVLFYNLPFFLAHPLEIFCSLAWRDELSRRPAGCNGGSILVCKKARPKNIRYS